MSSSLLTYLSDAATSRANELGELISIPAIPLTETEGDLDEDVHLNLVLADVEGFIRATSFTPAVNGLTFLISAIF